MLGNPQRLPLLAFRTIVTLPELIASPEALETLRLLWRQLLLKWPLKNRNATNALRASGAVKCAWSDSEPAERTSSAGGPRGKRRARFVGVSRFVRARHIAVSWLPFPQTERPRAADEPHPVPGWRGRGWRMRGMAPRIPHRAKSRVAICVRALKQTGSSQLSKRTETQCKKYKKLCNPPMEPGVKATWESRAVGKSARLVPVAKKKK